MKQICGRYIIVTILWMFVIFWFSSKPADESTKQSNRVGYIVGNILVKDFAQMPKFKQEQFAKDIDFVVRKAAHATEYMVLAVLLVGCLIGKRRQYLYAWLIATIYACTDEVHQLFVPGRAGKIIDVCIDSAGAMLGVLLCILGMWLYLRVRIK